MDYTPPNNNNILFKFTKLGYSPPNFDNLTYNLGTTPSMSEIKATVVGMGLQRDYLKECQTYVVGYNAQSIVQTIRYGCVYGGIRDLAATISSLGHWLDLPAYIKSTMASQLDLIDILKGWRVEEYYDLSLLINGLNIKKYIDLPMYLKSTSSETIDLNSYVSIFKQHQLDLIKSIKGLSTQNILELPVYLKSTTSELVDLGSYISIFKQYQLDLTKIIKGLSTQNLLDLPIYLKSTTTTLIDLNSYVNIFKRYQLDLIKSIRGYATGTSDLINAIRSNVAGNYTELSWYIKATINQQTDLSTEIFKILQRQTSDLSSLISGAFWFVGADSANINGVIQALHTNDLSMVVRSTYITDLNTFLQTIQPVDIKTSIMGWATRDLTLSVTKAINYSDITAGIGSITPLDLKLSLYGRKDTKIIKDLAATLTGSYYDDLSVLLRVIRCKDLNAYLMSSLQLLDLTVKIYPKLVNIMQIINVSFLENRDLAATVNYPCFFSGFVDLPMQCVIKNSKTLSAYIFSWTGDNIKDIYCSINSSKYLTQNTIPVEYVSVPRPSSSIILRYSNTAVIHVTNKIDISWASNRVAFDLPTNIYGNPVHKDLSARIGPYINRDYPSSNTTSSIITLKLTKNLAQFTRNVELAFNSYAHKYYYFSGNKKAYREYRNDHWTVVVEGHELLPIGKGFEKTKVRRKYIFSLKDYDSMDEAIRDMIDRVTLLRSIDLNVQIQASADRVSNLLATLKVHRIYKTNRVLKSVISSWQTKVLKDLLFDITPVSLYADSDLNANIISDSFTPNTNFNFTGGGSASSVADDLNFTFEIEVS